MHTIWQTARFTLDLSAPKIMGIINITPDSFSDGGTYSQSIQAALKHAEQLLEDGADILDIGGESTRPNADYVPPEAEWQRVQPILAELARWNVPVSLDTRRAGVMRAALERGWADIINDVQGLEDTGAVEIVAQSDRNQGEIQVRGNWVTGSYYHSPAQDGAGAAAVFRGSEINDEEEIEEHFTADGWLHTGDVGSVSADGYLTIHDRARDVIRSGGEWIYSALLENEIMAAKPVVECAVIGYPDKKWGERPLAVTVVADGGPRDRGMAEQLRDHLRESFPSWMLPEYWTFVDSIDKTSVGKFDKVDLRQHLANGEYSVIALVGPGQST